MDLNIIKDTVIKLIMTIIKERPITMSFFSIKIKKEPGEALFLGVKLIPFQFNNNK